MLRLFGGYDSIVRAATLREVNRFLAVKNFAAVSARLSIHQPDALA